MAIAGSFLKVPENLYRIKREWPSIFEQLVGAAVERNLIPFLTEFGGLQESTNKGISGFEFYPNRILSHQLNAMEL